MSDAWCLCFIKGYLKKVCWMKQVAKMNNTTLPPATLFIIRFHSFYGKQNKIKLIS